MALSNRQKFLREINSSSNKGWQFNKNMYGADARKLYELYEPGGILNTKLWFISNVSDEELKRLCEEVSSYKNISANELEVGIQKLIDEGPVEDPDKKVKCKGCINHNAPTGVCILGTCVSILKWCWKDGVYVPCGIKITIQL